MVQFDFTAAHVNEDGELCLKVINTLAARQFVLGMRERMVDNAESCTKLENIKNQTIRLQVAAEHKKIKVEADK